MPEQQIRPAPARNNVEVMAQYVMPGGMFNMLRNLEQIVRIVIGWSTCTLEVFVRYEFGERYLSVGRVIIGLLTIRFFLMLADMQTALSWLPGINPLSSQLGINRWHVTCYILLSCVHLARIWQRNHAGVPWHSHSFGVSWLDFLTWLPPLQLGRYTFRITDWMLYRFVEPVLCFAVAWYMVPGPSFSRSWFLWASVAMLIHNNMVYNTRRTRFLDMLDSHIESGYYNEMRSEALGQQSGQRNWGYVTMPLPPIPMPKESGEVDISATVAETMGTLVTTRQLPMESVLNSHQEE